MEYPRITSSQNEQLSLVILCCLYAVLQDREQSLRTLGRSPVLPRGPRKPDPKASVLPRLKWPRETNFEENAVSTLYTAFLMDLNNCLRTFPPQLLTEMPDLKVKMMTPSQGHRYRWPWLLPRGPKIPDPKASGLPRPKWPRETNFEENAHLWKHALTQNNVFGIAQELVAVSLNMLRSCGYVSELDTPKIWRLIVLVPIAIIISYCTCPISYPISTLYYIIFICVNVWTYLVAAAYNRHQISHVPSGIFKVWSLKHQHVF